jgi:hypothetical protein
MSLARANATLPKLEVLPESADVAVRSMCM